MRRHRLPFRLPPRRRPARLRVTAAGVLAAGLFGALGSRSFADPAQASVSPAVELAVRNRASSAIDAVFALRSPAGEVRSAHARAAEGAFATVVFGTVASAGAFGSPDARFSPALSGLWTWTCRVNGDAVAHGAFNLARNADGTASIRTDPPNFKR